PEVEFDRLPWPRDDERRVRLDDRPEPLEREAACHGDEELLANPDVDDARRMSACGVALAEARHVDLAEDDHEAGIGVERVGHDVEESVAHPAHACASGVSATTTWGRSPGAAAKPASIAS